MQDKEVVEVELPVPAGPPQRALRHLQIAEFTADPAADPAADQQSMLPWLGNVRLVRVAANGPGHRAFKSDLGANEQVQAAAPTRDFKPGQLIGFYLGRLTILSQLGRSTVLGLSTFACTSQRIIRRASNTCNRWTRMVRCTT